MKRANNQLESGQILDVIEKYTTALNLLDDYDHQKIKKPEGTKSTYVLKYDECKDVILKMRFAAESDLFGNEKDNSFESSINAIYQTFGGQEVYPSIEEKAANLLHFGCHHNNDRGIETTRKRNTNKINNEFFELNVKNIVVGAS